MKRYTYAGLIVLILISLGINSLPMLQHQFWGMDEGEYIVMTGNIVRTGTISPEYHGWTVAYPYFQGYFALSSSFSILSGISPFQAVWAPVFFSFIAVIAVFLMGKKVNGTMTGFFAALFLLAAMPFSYQSSHPAPESLGHTLFVLTLLLLWKPGKRSILASLLLSAALITVHPLSSYILLIAAGGSYMIKAFRKEDTGEIFLFLCIYSYMMLAYWFFFGRGFTEGVLEASGINPYHILLLTSAALLFIYIFGKGIKRPHISRSIPSRRNITVSLYSLALISLIIILYSVFFRFPGTDMKGDPAAIVFYSPLIVLFLLSSTGVSLARLSSKALETWGWLLAIGLSALAGTFYHSDVLIPFRHIEYLVVPLSILFGIGIRHLYIISRERGKGRLLVSSIILLLLLNMAIIYPPPQYMQGFQESTDYNEIPGIIAASHMYGRLATDHRLSTDVFAAGKQNVSWDDAKQLLMHPENSTYTASCVLLTEKMRTNAVFGWRDRTVRIDPHPFYSGYLLYSDGESNIFVYSGRVFRR